MAEGMNYVTVPFRVEITVLRVLCTYLLRCLYIPLSGMNLVWE